MRELPLIIVLALCVAVPAGAQVSVDLHALESLPGTNAHARRPEPRPPQTRPKVTLAPTATGAPAATAIPAATAQPAPATPLAAPPPGVEASITTPPIAEAPPPPAQMAPKAPAPEAPTPATANLRIPFSTDQADFSKEGSAALDSFLRTSYETGAPAFTIIGYAAGKQDDPSAARRLSLARAMAARNFLMNNGVPSRRITLRALGSQAAGGPPDRVDIGATPSTTP
jgi:outer membrane protein OmpA-like peptidoglycan-associated protein